MESLKVLLVEDHPMVRLGLSLVFEKTNGNVIININCDAPCKRNGKFESQVVKE